MDRVKRVILCEVSRFPWREGLVPLHQILVIRHVAEISDDIVVVSPCVRPDWKAWRTAALCDLVPGLDPVVPGVDPETLAARQIAAGDVMCVVQEILKVPLLLRLPPVDSFTSHGHGKHG